jgi:hypothetical protein
MPFPSWFPIDAPSPTPRVPERLRPKDAPSLPTSLFFWKNLPTSLARQLPDPESPTLGPSHGLGPPQPTPSPRDRSLHPYSFFFRAGSRAKPAISSRQGNQAELNSWLALNRAELTWYPALHTWTFTFSCLTFSGREDHQSKDTLARTHCIGCVWWASWASGPEKEKQNETCFLV